MVSSVEKTRSCSRVAQRFSTAISARFTRRWGLYGRSSRLLRQSHLAHQLRKPRIATYRVKPEVSLQTDKQPIVFLIGDVEPMEGLLLVSQVGIEARNVECREIAILTLCFPIFSELRDSTLPSRGTESLFHGRSGFGIGWKAGQLATGLPFVNHLRVHVLPPIGLGQAIMRNRKRRVVIRQFRANRDGF